MENITNEEYECCLNCEHFKMGIYESDSWCYLWDMYTTPREECDDFKMGRR